MTVCQSLSGAVVFRGSQGAQGTCRQEPIREMEGKWESSKQAGTEKKVWFSASQGTNEAEIVFSETVRSIMGSSVWRFSGHMALSVILFAPLCH